MTSFNLTTPIVSGFGTYHQNVRSSLIIKDLIPFNPVWKFPFYEIGLFKIKFVDFVIKDLSVVV
jgi:hypothetical protein